VRRNMILAFNIFRLTLARPGPGGEQKTKPTQRAVSDVRSAGLSPDLVSQSVLTNADVRLAHT
jgi:CTP synthase (UTP-ammonia lyase)